MDNRQIEAIGAICVMAALADGSTSPTERERIEGIFKGLADGGDEARALGAMEVVLLAGAEQGLYSYANKKDWEGNVDYVVAKDDDAEARGAIDVALAAWRALGCRDGGRVDVRSDAQGRPSFIEANPLAGLNPTISDLAILARQVGWDYPRVIAAIMASAQARLSHA